MKVAKTHIKADVEDASIVVRFSAPELTLNHDVDLAVREIDEVLAQSKAPVLVINFAQVRRLSSAFLGKLIGLHKRLSANRRQLRLCGMSPDLANIYKIMNLQSLFKLYDSEEAAIKG